MSEKTFKTFDEFWPFYVREHSQKRTRQLHFLGTGAALATLAAAVTLRSKRLALLAPLLGYGPAWLSHGLIEKNRPATFRHPLWSLQADLKMFSMMLNGTMDDEVRRYVDGDTGDSSSNEQSKARAAEAVRLVRRMERAPQHGASNKVWN